MGELRNIFDDLNYDPPTADQLARRKFIREKIELLSVRPLRDTLNLQQDLVRIRPSDRMALIAVVFMACALGVTLLWGWL